MRRALIGALGVAATLMPVSRSRADEPAAERAIAARTGDDWGLSFGVHVENGNHRSFHHVEPATGEVRTYDARVYGGVGVALGLERPFADGLFSWSLDADYWRSLFFSSGARRLGKIVDTTAQRASVLAGVAGRTAATPRAVSFGLLAGVSAMRFEFAMPEPKTADDETMQLPTGNYTLLGVGIGARVPVSALAFSIRGIGLFGLHTGAFGGREVQAPANGFDGLAVIEYRLLPWLDIFARGGVTHLQLRLAALEARPADAPADVRDLYLTLGIGTRARFAL